MIVPCKAGVFQKKTSAETKSLDELADEIDEKLCTFELQVASLLEFTQRGYPLKTKNNIPYMRDEAPFRNH